MGDRSPPKTSRPAWADLHLWQIQGIRDLLMAGAVLLLLWLGQRLSLVTVPLLLALLLAYLFEPVVERLTRLRKVSRQLAAAVMVLASTLLIALPALFGLGFGVLQGVEFAGGVARNTGAVVASLQDPEDEALKEACGSGAWLKIRETLFDLQHAAPGETEVEVLGIDREALTRAIQVGGDWLRDNAERVASTAFDTGRGALTVAVSTVGSLGKMAFGAFLTAFFFFFVSAAWPKLLELGRSLMPDKERERAIDIVQRMDRAVNGFIRGRVTIAFVQSAVYTIGFWLIGVPAPLIFGPAVALITLVPYAGLLAVPVVMVMLWLQGHEGLRGELWWVIVAPLGLYQIGQVLDDYVLTPLIQGKSTDLNTPTILFASIAGGLLLGFFGMLVAIPLAACAKILFDQIFWPRFKAWAAGTEKDFLPVDRG